MEILREMTRRQHELGYLSEETLGELAKQFGVPLYRIEGLASFYTSFRREPPPQVEVTVCRDVTCAMAGGCADKQQLLDELKGRDDVEVVEVSCIGRCDSAPAVAVNDHAIAPVSLRDIDQVMGYIDHPLSAQRHSASELGAVQCDPYASEADRYSTVKQLVADGDVGDTCIERLKASRLRGMGGAGFPTGLKWEFVRSEQATPKYVICNADESEPGTFKDREILRNLPHLVIEGMVMAAITIGAEQGIVFLRHEYEREKASLDAAIEQARATGILGASAVDSGQAFDIEVFVSPGGYILGEETALLEALEDKRGEPRNKPPYPGTFGLWGQPTLVNNVETFAFATAIVNKGSEWWEAQGKDGFAGLKFVSVSGDVVNPGVHEIPIGTTVAELIDICGGMKDGDTLKAFLPGGASSNFLPADKVDTPLDFDAMKQAGSMLGTGAVVVIGERHDLFELATNIVKFFRNESCGKCVPCRVGSEKSVELLESVQAGTSSPAQLTVLSELGDTLEQTSICGLGQVALNPILSMMKHFPNEVPQ
ncbi:MAG: NADH:ubiquinone oxidoreductase subunit F (NADH-binding)/NADH:ubiquinone oxidoreductase subunit E [Pirellulaceae bacterium]